MLPFAYKSCCLRSMNAIALFVFYDSSIWNVLFMNFCWARASYLLKHATFMQHRYLFENATVNIESALKAFLLTHSIQNISLQKCYKHCTDLLRADINTNTMQCDVIKLSEQFNSFVEFQIKSFVNGSRWTRTVTFIWHFMRHLVHRWICSINSGIN